MDKQQLIDDIKELLLGNLIKTIVELQCKKEKFERLGIYEKVEVISEELEFAEIVEEIVLSFEDHTKIASLGLNHRVAMFGVHLVMMFPRIEQLTIEQLAREYNVTSATIHNRLNSLAEAVVKELEGLVYVQIDDTQDGL